MEDFVALVMWWNCVLCPGDCLHWTRASNIVKRTLAARRELFADCCAERWLLINFGRVILLCDGDQFLLLFSGFSYERCFFFFSWWFWIYETLFYFWKYTIFQWFLWHSTSFLKAVNFGTQRNCLTGREACISYPLQSVNKLPNFKVFFDDTLIIINYASLDFKYFSFKIINLVNFWSVLTIYSFLNTTYFKE